MKVNNLNCGVQMSANRYNTKLNKMKREKAQNLSSSPQSFGMKMNNQHATLKDRVSFGGPFGDWTRDTATVTFVAGCKKNERC